jgi:hypothetical protein
MVLLLSNMNPIHVFPSYSTSIFNIILPLCLGLPSYKIFLPKLEINLPHSCYMPRRPHPPWALLCHSVLCRVAKLLWTYSILTELLSRTCQKQSVTEEVKYMGFYKIEISFNFKLYMERKNGVNFARIWLRLSLVWSGLWHGYCVSLLCCGQKFRGQIYRVIQNPKCRHHAVLVCEGARGCNPQGTCKQLLDVFVSPQNAITTVPHASMRETTRQRIQ